MAAPTPRLLLLLLLAVLAACTSPPPAPVVVAQPSAVPVAQREVPEVALAADDDAGDLGPLPVTAADPQRGSRSALVTFVLFGDMQCPFTKRLAGGTVADLQREYGPEKLRVVWKHFPLPFHKDARPAAETSIVLFQRGGPEWFWRYHDVIFATTTGFSSQLYDDALVQFGLSRAEADRLIESSDAAAKVDADLELGKRVGVTGTPASFINGVFLSGAQPIEKFREVIDQQLERAEKLVASGVPRAAVYAKASEENFARRPAAAAKTDEDKKIYRVPVGTSPVLGKPTALVTLVVFSDLECPFCRRVEPTVKQLQTEYGDQLRVVWKHNPLPFHKRAEPAAELMIEARAQRGDAAFWKAHDLLFALNGKLEDADLQGVAAAVGLNAPAAMRAIAARKHRAIIEADQELADELNAGGTPHFFANGRRIVGAQPIEKFRSVIDEQIAVAQAALKSGVKPAKLYEALQKDAIAGTPLETVNVPPPTKANPSKGPAGAKVVIQIFADFQCPYCSRVAATLNDLDAAFPNKLRFVWRNLPLSFHKQAEPAAEAAMEAFAQRGAAGFWKMHDLLFQNQTSLERASLEQYAATIGLDAVKFGLALDTSAHRATIEADEKAAQAAGFTGTPSFAINNYKLVGAQPLAKFKKVVRQALAEAR